ncbi:MAG: OmpA family protein [Ignavibacteriales bacterium]|nr:OmpA family protein [Ignavibacteriales bacterium]
MQQRSRNISIRKILLLLGGIVLALGGVERLHAAGTPAGTIINSRALATYTDFSGNRQDSLYSNVVSVVIRQVASLNITPPSFNKTVSSDSVAVDFPITITNSGNGLDVLKFFATSSMGWLEGVYLDLDRDGILQSGEIAAGRITETPSLPADNSFFVIVRIFVPRNSLLNGQQDTTIFTVQSQFDSLKRAAGRYVTTVHTAQLAPVVLSVDLPTPYAEQDVTLSLSFTNTGSVPAANVSVTDVLPPEFNYQRSGTVSGVYNPATRKVVWAIGAVAPEATVNLSVVVRVPLTVPVGTTIPNAMTVQYALDANTFTLGSNIVRVTVAKVPGPDYDFELSPIQFTSQKEISDTVVYAIKVKNTGTKKDVFELAFVDTLIGWNFFLDKNRNGLFDPTDLQIKIKNGSAGVQADSVAPGDSVRIFVTTASPLPPVQFDQTEIISSFVASSSGKPSLQKAATARITISRPVISLAVGMNVQPRYAPNDTIVYAISYQNDGHSAADSLTVVNSVPGETRYIPNSIVLNGILQQDAGGPVSISDIGGRTTIKAQTGSLASGRNGRLAFSVRIADKTPSETTIANGAVGIYRFRALTDTARAFTNFTVSPIPNFTLRFSVANATVARRDTALLWLAYENTGNAASDIVIRNTIDRPGMQYVRIPGGAVLSGDTLIWRLSNVVAGVRDSVSYVVRISDSASVGSALISRASLQWGNGTVSALQPLNIRVLPNLAMTVAASLKQIRSGRNLDYVITLTNSGTGSADGIVVVDSLSLTGTYLSATVTPASVTSNGRIITWNLGSLSAGQSRSINLTVRTQPNLLNDSLVATTTTFATNITGILRAAVTTPILRLRPALVKITPRDKYIFGGSVVGGLPEDSTLVTVVVTDSIGLEMPDGVPVSLTTTHGTFAGGVRTMLMTTINGGVTFYLRSEYVTTTFVVATIQAIAGIADTSQGMTTVTMFPGGVTGLVRDGLTLQPIKGAVAEVRNSIDVLLGRDVTEADGIFFIALEKKLENFPYTLTLSVRDEFGDTIRTTTTVDPTVFPRATIHIKNTIAGRLQYAQKAGQFVPIPGVIVYLDSVTRSTKIPKPSLAQEIGKMFRVRSTVTDEAGRFRFDSLTAAVYRIMVDSVRFPNYAGEVSLSDTTEGTFTVNMNINVKPDSSLSLALSGPSRVYAGDTVKLMIHYANSGNMVHSNVVLRNILPPFVTLDSVQRGAFDSTGYDAASRTVRWKTSTLGLNVSDSVWIRMIVAKNVPENTRLADTAWIGTDKLTRQASNPWSAIVRSAPVLFIRNLILSGKDSVLAGDSLHFALVYGNTGTGIARNVLIVDSLRGFLRSLVTPLYSTRAYRDTVLSKDSIIAWKIDSLAAGSIDTLHVRVKTDPGILAGAIFRTHAYFYLNDTIRDDSPREVAVLVNPLFANYLELNKIGNKKTVEIGDVVTYQVTVKNNSAFTMTGLDVTDRLPYAFKYYKSSARWNGKRVEPLLLSNATALRWVLDTLRAGQMGAVMYQVVVGADALESDGINSVYASATLPPGVPVIAQPKQWQVLVKAGVFTERGLIIGKVFYDDDRNLYQSKGENGVKGVDLWMEDGTRITTGDDGKFSLPDVKPGQHVLRVDERSLPSGTKLIPGLTRFAGDAASQFVRLTESGIARANFYVQRMMRDSLAQTIAKGTQFTLQRLMFPQYLYVHENFRPGSQYNTMTISARFTYSGSTYLQRILLHDTVPEEMSYVSGTGEFNGRKVEPKVNGRELLWNLGRTPAIGEGRLNYRLTARPVRAQEVTVRLSSTIELMTADSLSMTSDPLAAQVTMRNAVLTEKIIPLSGRIFENGKSSVAENGASRLQEITGHVQSSPFAEFVMLTYPDGMRTLAANDTTDKALAASRAMKLEQNILRKAGEDSTRVSVQSIFNYRRFDTTMQAVPGDVELRMQTYSYNGSVPMDTGYVLTAAFGGTAEPSEKAYRDTVKTIPGDNVMFRGVYVADPAVKHTTVILIDSLIRSIAIDENSFTVNGVKVPLGSFSLRSVSPALSLNKKAKFREADFRQILSIEMTNLLKPGLNEFAFMGRVAQSGGAALVVNKMFVRLWNAFQEESLIEAKRTVILIDKSLRVSKTVLEPPAQHIRTAEPVAAGEAAAKLESLKESVGKVIILEGITFLPASRILTPGGKMLLGQIVTTLKENPEMELEISGHTDNVGTAGPNRKLSLARAESVKSFLIGLGISPLRLTTKGYGPDKPIADNSTAAGQAKNRRVEFARTK